MPVGLKELPALLPVAGVRWGVACAGIKKPGRRDLALMELAAGSTGVAVFTRNAFCAAPVVLAKQHLAQCAPRWFIVNTGNANAGTGEAGLADARACCAALGQLVDCAPSAVLPFSTGVIGEPLPVGKITQGLPDARANLTERGWEDAAHAIMTTDIVPKGASRQFSVDGVTLTVTGIAKGSGMIRPDMATMLAFVATDAGVSQTLLQQCLADAVATSFNSITVDGDTSTNDACMLVATGRVQHAPLTGTSPIYRELCTAVREVCEQLAQAVVRDGEGATKFITVEINQASSVTEGRQVAYTVAHSPLVKTAFFASDPNWGRILAAVGRAGVAELDLNALTIFLDDVCIVRNGGRALDYQEAHGQHVMQQEEITIRVNLARGHHTARVWTCDFSYDYVRINAEYRT